MRASKAVTSMFLAIALGASVGGAAPLPALGAQAVGETPGAVEQVDSGVLPSADERPHTRMKAVMTGPLQFSFVVRPKLPSGENWKVVLKVKECGKDKDWIVVQRARTKGRREVFTPDAEKVISKLMKDDGRNSGVRAYRLVTPEQRGYARTVKTFRNYPLDPNGLIRIGSC